MAEPFRVKELTKPPLFYRVFRRKWKAHAFIELNNLLASAADIGSVRIETVANIFAAYEISLNRDFFQERQALFVTLFEYCLQDRHLDEAEIKNLKHLRGLLCLSEADVASAEQEVAKAVYAESIEEVFEDRRVSEEEKHFLAEVQKRLRLPVQIAENVYALKAQTLLQRTLDRAIEDQRLSEDEDEELRILAENLGAEITHDEETAKVLDKFRLYAQIENGDLPQIDPEIKMPRAEICHFKTKVDWYEHRKVTTGYGYSGPTVRLRIMKGVYWRAGNMSIKRTSEDVLKLIDSGDCFLTNRRIIFRGERGNKTIPLGRIIDLEAFSNGVQIEKDRGKSPFLEFEPGSDVFAMILDRAIDRVM